MVWLLLWACTVPDPPVVRPAPEAWTVEQRRDRGRVVLVTIDGLRWQDALDAGWRSRADSHPLLPQLTMLGADGVVLGDLRTGSRVEVEASLAKSLPSYQGMMAGSEQPCASNHCGPITVETLPERLVRELALTEEEVAVFGTWGPIVDAASSGRGGFTLESGFQGGEVPPWSNSRWDADTLDAALAHLAEHRTRFLWVALGDVDEWAHEADLARYLDAARASDDALSQLIAALAAQGTWNDTTLIVTTDHGRGLGPFWPHHSEHEAARAVWLVATGPEVVRAGRVHGGEAITLGRLRPTVEMLLGLEASGEGLPWIATGVPGT